MLEDYIKAIPRQQSFAATLLRYLNSWYYTYPPQTWKMKFLIGTLLLIAIIATVNAKAVDLTSQDLEDFLRRKLEANMDRVFEQAEDDYGTIEQDGGDYDAEEQDSDYLNAENVARVMADRIVDKFTGTSQKTQAKSQLLGLGASLLGSLFSSFLSRRSRRRGWQNEEWTEGIDFSFLEFSILAPQLINTSN